MPNRPEAHTAKFRPRRTGKYTSAMANPEELRKQDQRLPRQQRKYPQSRVTQALYVMLALVVIAAIVGGLV